MQSTRLSATTAVALILFATIVSAHGQVRGLQSSDLLKLRSVGEVQFSPDGTSLAYTIVNNNRPGRPYSQLWIQTLSTGKLIRVGGEGESSGNPEWSPDSQWLAYQGGGKSSLRIVKSDGTGEKSIAQMQGTNSPLPSTGRSIAWSPVGKRVVFVS